MGDIIERLNNLNDIEDLKKLVKEVLKRDLTNEELSLIENEDDEIIENLLREITQELEKNIPEEEKEDFYANISEDLLVYIEDDKRKLERPEVFKGGPATLKIISSMKDVQDKIRAVDFIPDEFAREDLIKKLGTEFLREYIKSPNRTMKDADLEVVIRTYGDRECVKEYIKLNPKGSKVYLIQGVGDIDFIKECLEDEEIEFTKGERIELIKKAKDIELTRNAIYDESLGLTNNEKLGLLESVNNLGLISTYIHDENCSLSEENICALVKSTNNREFIKNCILDNTLGINRNARMSMVQSVNEDIGIVQEIMDSPELGLNEGEKTNIVAQTNNVAFIENFLEVEENLGNNNQYKLLHMVEKDSAFIKKLIREDRIIQGSHNKLNFILNTGDQEFIKESIYDKNTSWNPSGIRELIASVEDEAFVEKCFQDEQLNLQTEDIYQILDIGNFSQDFFKRCILNPELDVDDDERYDLVLKYIKDDEIVLEIVRDEKIDVETWKKLKLLGKVQEPVFSENIEEIMAILKQNDESYKEFRNESETPEGIYGTSGKRQSGQGGYDLTYYKIGKNGLESYFNSKLTGKSGYKKIEVNAYNIPIKDIEKDDPEKGNDLKLTIDLRLQKFIYDRVSDMTAAIVVMNVETGEIIALVSTPSFDVNNFVDGISNKEWIELVNNDKKPLYNKTISALYAMGSTFKPVVAIAALENGWDENKKIDCKGSMKISKKLNFRCWKKIGHGKINIVQAIERSCNIFFANLGLFAGVNNIYNVAKELGIGEFFDINLPEYNNGILPNPTWKKEYHNDVWTKGDTINMSIGQGYILANPLQLATMIARIVNNGYPIKPFLVYDSNLRDYNMSLYNNEPMFKEKNIKIVKKGMFEVINGNYGTASKLRTKSNSQISGKTGTAQVISLEAKEKMEKQLKEGEKLDEKYQNHGIFVGFAPYEKPKYAISVVIEHGGSGSMSAAPVAVDILRFMIDNNI